jgi:hypothetical protein
VWTVAGSGSLSLWERVGVRDEDHRGAGQGASGTAEVGIVLKGESELLGGLGRLVEAGVGLASVQV